MNYRVKMVLEIEVEVEVGDDGAGEPEYLDVNTDVRSHLQWLSTTTTGRDALDDIINKALEHCDVEEVTS
jgi:hypothetical protein